jgi:hypothetical protein
MKTPSALADGVSFFALRARRTGAQRATQE